MNSISSVSAVSFNARVKLNVPKNINSQNSIENTLISSAASMASTCISGLVTDSSVISAKQSTLSKKIASLFTKKSSVKAVKDPS